MKDYKDVVKSWLEGNFDEQTKSEVRKLQETDPVALEDAFYRNLEFGTGGLRGTMGVGTNRMNKYTVGMATQGLANYITPMYPAKKASASATTPGTIRNFSPAYRPMSCPTTASRYIFSKACVPCRNSATASA